MTNVAPDQTNEFHLDTNGSKAPKAKASVAVKLLKHYVPLGEYEIVGHDRPRIVAKDAAGREVVKQEAEFIKGEMMPPPYPGVGYPNKIWAGTTIRLPRDEAKTLYDSKRAERGFDD